MCQRFREPRHGGVARARGRLALDMARVFFLREIGRFSALSEGPIAYSRCFYSADGTSLMAGVPDHHSDLPRRARVSGGPRKGSFAQQSTGANWHLTPVSLSSVIMYEGDAVN
jgi:hypothetical protein